MLGLDFKGRYLGAREGSGVRGERSRILIISSSCLLSGDVLIRHLTVAASCGVMEASLSFFMVYCEKYL